MRAVSFQLQSRTSMEGGEGELFELEKWISVDPKYFTRFKSLHGEFLPTILSIPLNAEIGRKDCMHETFLAAEADCLHFNRHSPLMFYPRSELKVWCQNEEEGTMFLKMGFSHAFPVLSQRAHIILILIFLTL